MKNWIPPLLLLFLTACEDKAMVTVYRKGILQAPVTCMRLSLFPQDAVFEKALRAQYLFTEDCDLVLEVSYKSGIQCNSRFNVAAKTTSNFPNSYLKMELRKGMALQYSYYIDLKKKPDTKEIDRGWERMKKDLQITIKKI